ncbi:MAG: GTPase HflX [Thermotogae bacterium]|nr:GTPase HflX [Thermotogota bacterium]
MKKAILLGATYSKWLNIEKSLDELALLLKSIDIDPVMSFWQVLRTPLPSYLGTGKLNEIARYIKIYEADGVVTDDELNSVQRTSLEKMLKVEILDRTQVILKNFSRSATTQEGKIEVELATLEYALSHLIKSKDMSRLGGGIGTVGPGESKLETDRRTIKRKISLLETEIEKISREKMTKKSKRISSIIPKVSIVGYTNAGKSMLLKSLSGFEIKSENRLFTTLDPITRKVWIGENLYALFSDTVGFISKLPTQLVKAFKSTLDEIKDADLILLVIDGSDDDFEKKMQVSIDTISKIGATDIPILKIINKIDLCDSNRLSALSREYPDAIFVSALKRLYLDELLSKIREESTKDYIHLETEVDASQWQRIIGTEGIRIMSFNSFEGKVHAILKINPVILPKITEVQNVV